MMPSMFSIDHDIVGDSAAVTFQVVNPSLATSSAAFSTTFLQAITRNLSIGGGLISPMKNGQFGEIGGQLRAKYSRLQSPLTSSVNDWMVTTEAALDGSGVSAGYWQKLDSQVEAGAELDTRISPQSGKCRPQVRIQNVIVSSTSGQHWQNCCSSHAATQSNDGVHRLW